MNEHLQLDAQVGASGDLLTAHLAGQHYAGESRIAEKFDTLGSVAGQLRGCVECHLRHNGTQTAAQPHVLHDEGIHAALGGGYRHLYGTVDLVLAEQGVEGQVHRHPTGMTIGHRLF